MGEEADVTGGRLFAGRYRLERELGRGGMGRVWLAFDERLQRRIALKRLDPLVAADESVRDRFAREAKALARIRHPGVVTVHDVGEADGLPYLVMDWCADGSLADRLEKGPLDARETRQVARDAADALAAIHASGIVHRDLKPANILRGDRRWLIGDFGIAASSGEESLTRTGVVLGTPEFWAPEMLDDSGVGPQADVYSLGCVLYACLAGRPPFVNTNRLRVGMMHVTEPVPALPIEVRERDATLARLVAEMLRKQPQARPLVDDVLTALGDETVGRLDDAPSRAIEGEAQDAPESATPSPDMAATRPLRADGRTSPTLVKRTSKRIWAAAGSVLVVSLGGLGLFLGVNASGGGRGTTTVTAPPTSAGAPRSFAVPRVVGLPTLVAMRRARQAAARAGVQVPSVDLARRHSETVPEGRVLAQSPRPGGRVRAAGRITLVVSLGSAFTRVPRFAVGASEAEVRQGLERAELSLHVTRRADFTVPAGGLIAMRPQTGARVRRGTQVTALFSTGVPMTTVPGVIGLDQADARARLEDRNLVVRVDERESERPAGTVIDQSPSAGSSIAQRSTVAIVVAIAPPPPPEPVPPSVPDSDQGWTTIEAIGGTGPSRTHPFTVNGPWRIKYSFEDRSEYGISLMGVSIEGEPFFLDNFFISETSVGTYAGPGPGTFTVQANPIGEADWSIEVQEYREGGGPSSSAHAGGRAPRKARPPRSGRSVSGRRRWSGRRSRWRRGRPRPWWRW